MSEEQLLSFGENIRRLRTKLNMSQDELAALCGYTDRSSIAKIESGKADIPQKKIKLFADALKVSPSVLLEKRLNNISSEEVERALRFMDHFLAAPPQVQDAVRMLIGFDQLDP